MKHASVAAGSTLADVRRFVGKGRNATDRRYVLPYGEWTEPSGALVLFDRRYRPICRVYPSGTWTPVPSSERIKWVSQRWLYNDSTPDPVAAAAEPVARLGLLPLILERWDAECHGALPTYDGYAPQPFMPGVWRSARWAR